MCSSYSTERKTNQIKIDFPGEMTEDTTLDCFPKNKGKLSSQGTNLTDETSEIEAFGFLSNSLSGKMSNFLSTNEENFQCEFEVIFLIISEIKTERDPKSHSS